MGALEDVLAGHSQDMGRPDPHSPSEENSRILRGAFLPAIGIHADHILAHVQHAQSTEFAPATEHDKQRLAKHIQDHVEEWLVKGKEKTMGPPTIEETVDMFNKKRPNYRPLT